jgi:hypothetical protein
LSNWKKLVVSGSGAHLASVTASNGSIISGSLTMSGSIRTVDYMDFIEATGSKVPAELTGRIYYDSEEAALTVYSNISNTQLYVGQEEHYLVKNNSGTTINVGQLVMFSGSIGNSGRLTTQLCDQTKLPSSVYVMGIAANTMNDGDDGFVINFGKIKGINATGTPVGETWNNGDILYVHPTIPGALTNQLPPDGKWKLIVAAVVNNTANGTIFVRLTPANNIGELDNVRDVSSTNGDLLVKSGSIWKNTKQLTGSYGVTGSIDISGNLIINGTSYTAASSGTSGTSGANGSSGTSGNSGSSGTSGNSGSSGTSGANGSSGTSGNSGSSGTSGTSGASGSSGTSGTGFSTVSNASDNRVLTSDGTSNAANAETNLTFDGSTLAVTGKVTATSFTGSLQYFEYDVNTNTSHGIGIGKDVGNNYNSGIGIGYGSKNQYNNGIGIGAYTETNRDRGVGIGYNSSNNYNRGVGVGTNSPYNYDYGVGIGPNTGYNNSYGVGIGANATSAAKGTGTVAIGAYSNSERQNEFVTTATGNSTNKAQSIIQKFREKSLSSSGGIWQEIFTDASSARLTILESSVYHYRIQINAIGATGFLCKTWEITGAIKRDTSNNTTMVGGAPTYVITSEDTSTGNWDVRVTADDTNEALEIEVKHDYANNVTFSVTVWATETRL